MMNKIWDKLKSRDAISYFIFGAVAAMVNFAVYAAMVKLGLEYRMAAAAAWAVSFLFALLVNQGLVYLRENHRPAYIFEEKSSFVMSMALSGMMEVVFMIALVTWFQINLYISMLLVSVMVLAANYVFSNFNREIISYLFFGILTTVVNFAVYGGMVKAGTDYRIATAAAWVISVLFAFAVNKLFVFQSGNMRLVCVFKELFSFAACRALSGVMEMAFMIVMVSWLLAGEYISKLLVSIIVMIVNYVLSKFFIFKKSEEKTL